MTKKKREDPIRKAVELSVGLVGLGVASSIAAPLTGTTGLIVKDAVLPVAGLGLLASAAGNPNGKKKKKELNRFGYESIL